MYTFGGERMANIKQQIKRNKTNEKKRQQSAAFKSLVKTTIKKVEIAVDNKDLEEAKVQYALACSKLDKAHSKGIYHKNYINRKKSNLAKLVNSIA